MRRYVRIRPAVCCAARRRRCRHGSAYALVLGCAALVALAGMTAVTLARRQTRAASQSRDWTEAGVLAQSAIEDAVLVLNSKAGWRTQYSNDVETGTQSLGHGTMWFKLVDE